MAFHHSTDVDAPIDDVFAWHTRPGAIMRLSPPWQPVEVERESESLEDGEAVLALPAGVKWRATHQPSGFQPGRQFTDVLTTPVIGSVVRWHHTHEFMAVGEDATRVVDRVETVLPGRLLRSMFAYRSRQLIGDIDAHHRIAGPRLTVAMTGSSGLIGTALAAFLTTGGHRVIRLVRYPASGPDERRWDPAQPAPDLLEGVDAVVHLAGASIAGRFNEKHKQAVLHSRVGPTRRLSEVAARAGIKTMVSSSAIGIYGSNRGDEQLTEDSERGDGFLADVVAGWEADTDVAADAGVRVVKVRTGVVQSPAGGSLALLRPLFQLGLGGRLGDGTQWLSWIGIDDMLDVYLGALLDSRLSGPVNAVAPEPVRNTEYTKTLARVLHRPAVVWVPPFGPAVLLGREGASEVALASQRVVPSKLTAIGHRFRYPTLEGALRHVLGRTDAERPG